MKQITQEWLDLQSLNQFAVEFRYPGECADKELAGQAVRICKRIRIILRAELGLEKGSITQIEPKH
jgi:hypothetical protein